MRIFRQSFKVITFETFNKIGEIIVSQFLFFFRKNLTELLECINSLCSYIVLSRLLFRDVSPRFVERRCRTRRKHFRILLEKRRARLTQRSYFLTARTANLGKESCLKLTANVPGKICHSTRSCRNFLANISLGKITNE